MFFFYKKPDIKKITNISSSNKKVMKQLAKKIFDSKWPKQETENGIFSFLFDCTSFLKVFLVIGMPNLNYSKQSKNFKL
jgi:hypothetical protein